MLNFIYLIISLFIFFIVSNLYIPTEETVLFITFIILILYIYINYGSSIYSFFNKNIQEIKDKFVFFINIKHKYLSTLIFLYKNFLFIITLISNLIELFKNINNNIFLKEKKYIINYINVNFILKLKELIEVERSLIKKIQNTFLENLYDNSLSLCKTYQYDLLPNIIKQKSNILVLNLNRLDILTKNNKILSIKKDKVKKLNLFIN